MKAKYRFSVFIIFFLLLCGAAREGFAQPGALREKIRERATEKIEALKEGKGKFKDSAYPVIKDNRLLSSRLAYGAGDYRRYLQSGRRQRFYDLHVPAGYDKSRPVALVLNFHGGSGNPVQQRQDTGMDKVSDANGFITLYPAGTGKFSQEKMLFFNAGVGKNSAVENNIDDVGFVAAILDDVARFFNIDPKRIYCTGFSNGGFMCYRLANEMSERFAAIAPVAGSMVQAAYQGRPKRPIPVIHFHGKNDPLVPYLGGLGGASTLADAELPSVVEVIDYWFNFDGCPENPRETLRKGAAVCTIYGPGKDNSEVILWTLEDAGHTWPGGNIRLPEIKVGSTNRDINASELIWEFFSRHTLS